MRVARSIGNSPLVKTALFASDPNLGRLLMAIGNAQVESLDTARLAIRLAAAGAEGLIVHRGRPRPHNRE